jgi:hypothetical protein
MPDNDLARAVEWAERAGQLRYFVQELVALARLHNAPTGFVAEQVAQLAAQAERTEGLGLDEEAIARSAETRQLAADLHRSRRPRKGRRDA